MIASDREMIKMINSCHYWAGWIVFVAINFSRCMLKRKMISHLGSTLLISDKRNQKWAPFNESMEFL